MTQTVNKAIIIISIVEKNMLAVLRKTQLTELSFIYFNMQITYCFLSKQFVFLFGPSALAQSSSMYAVSPLVPKSLIHTLASVPAPHLFPVLTLTVYSNERKIYLFSV